jgi:uncharacterized membrane protein YkvA (DUF1232 family)
MVTSTDGPGGTAPGAGARSAPAGADVPRGRDRVAADRGGASHDDVDVPPDPRSSWLEMREMVPDVVRLLRTLATDPRVPVRAKLVAGAAVGYAVLPLGRVGRLVPGGRVGADDAVALVFAVRHLIGAAGYDLVREVWTGTDAGFGLLVVLAGVDR